MLFYSGATSYLIGGVPNSIYVNIILDGISWEVKRQSLIYESEIANMIYRKASVFVRSQKSLPFPSKGFALQLKV